MVRSLSTVASTLLFITPFSFAAKPDYERWKNLPAALEKRIYGQNIAKRTIVDETLRILGDVNDPHKPRLRLLLCGPTGMEQVGLAVAYADAMGIKHLKIPLAEANVLPFNSFLAMIAGYLAEDPHLLVIFDEVDRASPIVQIAVAKFLASSRLSVDPENKPTGFKGTEVSTLGASVILITSAGREYLTEFSQRGPLGFQRETPPFKMDRLKEEVSEYISPEILDQVKLVPIVPVASERELEKVLQHRLPSILQDASSRFGKPFQIPQANELVNEISHKHFGVDEGTEEAIRELRDRVTLSLAEKVVGPCGGAARDLVKKGDPR